MRPFIKKAFFVASVLFALSVCQKSFCSGLAEPNDASLSQIQKKGTLKVCSDAGFLPFEMRTASGDWTGFDVDMMKDFAKSISVKLEMVQINFDGIIPALLAGKCDMIAAAMSVTPDRERVVSFSDTTFENGLSIAIKNTPENGKKYSNLESLDQKNILFAVRTGTTSDVYLSKKLKHARILRFDQDADLLLAVLQGRANAFVNDSTYVKMIDKANSKKLLVLATPITAEKYSVAGRKQDKTLMNSFNSFLKKWKMDGGYKKTELRYFGS